MGTDIGTIVLSSEPDVRRAKLIVNRPIAMEVQCTDVGSQCSQQTHPAHDRTHRSEMQNRDDNDENCNLNSGETGV